MKIIEGKKTHIKAFIDYVQLEDEALKQLQNLAEMPFIYKHIAVMPDAHWGMGSTVGSVIATQGAIIPAAVGVDIGCGMMAVRLPFNIDVIENVSKLRSSIERSIPVGFDSNKEVTDRVSTSINLVKPDGEAISKKHLLQLGTLGGGNHFIEICYDQYDHAWVMLHSGSRNLGKTSAEQHIDKAKGLMKQYFIELPDPDLAYFAQKTPEFDRYIADLLYAQEYAMVNRKEMMLRILKDISYHLGEKYSWIPGEDLLTINCHHNYSQLENHFDKNIWITRKGAVSAREGQYGIIPGSMGTRSYIVQGKGNPDSFCSCSHGAGRAMSRNKARERFTLEDHIQATEGVDCRKDSDVIDETPMAYKNIDNVIASQVDLVDVIYVLKQVLCVKG